MSHIKILACQHTCSKSFEYVKFKKCPYKNVPNILLCNISLCCTQYYAHLLYTMYLQRVFSEKNYIRVANSVPIVLYQLFVLQILFTQRQVEFGKCLTRSFLSIQFPNSVIYFPYRLLYIYLDILSFLEPCSVKSSCVSTIPSISAYIRLVLEGRSSVEFAFDVIAEA